MDRSIVYEVGDIVKLKKPHPCGSQEWEIMRVGADFRLKCLGCGHQIMVERKLVEKFAAKDEDGNIRVAQGRFSFRAPGERGEYEEQHRQLAETPAEIRFTKLRAPAPDTISVKSLEVLSRFIDFRGGDRK